MTISTTYDSRVDYAGNGSTTVFSTDNGSKSFVVFENTATDHSVIVKVVDSDGVTTTKVENTDYTVALTGTSPSLANITFTVAPASGETVYLISNPDFTQTINFNATGELDLDDVNTMADKLTILAQVLNASKQDLAIQLSDTSSLSGLEVGTPVNDGVWKWNSAGTELEFKTIAELVTTTAFDLADLTASTTLSGSADYMVFSDATDSSQYKATINDVVKAGLLGNTSLSTGEQDTIKTNLGITSGGGAYAQVAYEQITDDTEWSLTSGTSPINWQDIGFSTAITPGSSSNLVEVQGTLTFSTNNATTNGVFFYRIKRNGTQVLQGDADSNRTQVSFGLQEFKSSSGIATDTVSFCFVDSPASTSAQTYTIEVASPQVNCNWRLNGATNSTDHALRNRSISTLVLREITVS